jgi:hypothetical protein
MSHRLTNVGTEEVRLFRIVAGDDVEELDRLRLRVAVRTTRTPIKKTGEDGKEGFRSQTIPDFSLAQCRRLVPKTYFLSDEKDTRISASGERQLGQHGAASGKRERDSSVGWLP